MQRLEVSALDFESRSRSGFENWPGSCVLFLDNSASLYLGVKMSSSTLVGKPRKKQSIGTDYGVAFNDRRVGKLLAASSDGNRDRL